MENNGFVDYLNTLHNEQANNENALAEAQQNNPYFKKVKVERPEAQYIANRIETGENACLMILTGHAGDGKTTLLFQVLEKIARNISDIKVVPSGELLTNQNKKVRYIKDFSELTKDERRLSFKKALDDAEIGIYTILVANTGPLIDTFKDVFSDQEDAESTIIEQMDSSQAKETDLYGHRIITMNIARIDNTTFVSEFGQKIVDESNWEHCSTCDKRDLCPIAFNAQLVRQNKSALHFLKSFYIWEQNLDNRATIRQITAHLAFALTGGLNCTRVHQRVKPSWKAKYLFSNLLFGGTQSGDSAALQIKGVQMLSQSRIDVKNTSKDYEVLVQRNYRDLFEPALVSLCNDLEKISNQSLDVKRVLKRMLIVFPLGDDLRYEIYKDVFSTYYPDFLECAEGKSPNRPNRKMKKMILRALRIMFTGEDINLNESILITLRRSGEQIQNVQMLIGRIAETDIHIELQKIPSVSDENQKYKLVLRCAENEAITINMPLLDYFSKISSGLIVADIDPILSHGIESLKAKLIAYCKPITTDPNEVSLLVREEDSWKIVRMCFEDTSIESN